MSTNDPDSVDEDLLRTGEIRIHGKSEPRSDDTTALDVAAIRRDYLQSGLTRGELSSDPIVQFGRWIEEALSASRGEPTAMALATADAEGRPSVRMVLLKGYDARGFRFFTHYESRKGRELAANPRASLCFFWPELERQVRIEGIVERTSRRETEEYFSSRPHGSRLSAAVSPQSRVVAGRQELESRRREMENRAAGKEIEPPEDWGGYWLWPEAIEFWQGRADRFHDRLRYRRPAGADDWVIERLAP